MGKGPVVDTSTDPSLFLRDPIGFLMALYRKHGPELIFIGGRHDYAVALGPDLNKELHSRPDDFYSTGFIFPGPKGSAQRRLCYGLFSMNGEVHKRQRRLMMPAFQKTSMELYRQNMSAIIEDVLARWKPGETRDISDEMIQLTLRITCKLLFGLDDYELASRIDTVVENWLGLNSALYVGGSLSLRTVDQVYDEALAHAAQLEELVQVLLEKRRRLPPGNDIVSSLIELHDASPAGLSTIELLGQMAHLFAAANHTTKDALTWTLFLLAQHPDVLEKVHKETHGILHGQAPSLEQLDQLESLEMAIKESMRILPPVVYYSRMNMQPALLGPHSLPSHTSLVFSHYVTHHMSEIYEEPERFLPERWRMQPPNPYGYIPFGAGPRMCVGATFALMNLKIALSMIVQRFRLKVVPHTRIDRQVTTTLWPRYGLPMHIERQDRQFQASLSPVEGNIHEMVTLPKTSDWKRVAA